MNRPDPLTDAYTILETPRGPMSVAARADRLRGVILPCRLPKHLESIARRSWPAARLSAAILPDLCRQIEAYWQGHIAGFDVELDLDGRPPFYCKVWRAVRAIRPGTVVAYGQVARTVGRPKAARAVGRAMASNPMPLVVPCHRVVGHSGIGGFSATGGVGLKRALLEWERQHSEYSPSDRPERIDHRTRH